MVLRNAEFVFLETSDFSNQKSFDYLKTVQGAYGNLKSDKPTSSKETKFKHRFSISVSPEYINIFFIIIYMKKTLQRTTRRLGLRDKGIGKDQRLANKKIINEISNYEYKAGNCYQ